MIKNSDTIKRLLEDAGIQTSIEDVPRELARKILPVLISNPERSCNIIRNKTTSGTIYTTPTDRDFYLTDCFITNMDNAGNFIDDITVVIDGATQVICSCCGTAGIANSTTLNFTVPVKIDRGTNITSVKNTILSSFGIAGYTVNTSRR